LPWETRSYKTKQAILGPREKERKVEPKGWVAKKIGEKPPGENAGEKTQTKPPIQKPIWNEATCWGRNQIKEKKKTRYEKITPACKNEKKKGKGGPEAREV